MVKTHGLAQKIFQMPNESGDNAVTDISDLSFWSKLSICGIESAQSKLSTIRKLGCSLIANLAINSNNQNGKTLIPYHL